MQNKKRLLVNNRFIQLSMPGVSRPRSNRKKRVSTPNRSDPFLETPHGRRIAGGSYFDGLGKLWRQTTKPEQVERILQPRSREEEDEAVRGREEKKKARNTQLSELSRRPGFNIAIAMWSKMEQGAYANHRHPEHKLENISLDYFTGYQNGIIESVEIMRNMFIEANRQHYKEQNEGNS